MTARWLVEAHTTTGQHLARGHYARCGLCLGIFMLTTDGWEEVAGYGGE